MVQITVSKGGIPAGVYTAVYEGGEEIKQGIV